MAFARSTCRFYLVYLNGLATTQYLKGIVKLDTRILIGLFSIEEQEQELGQWRYHDTFAQREMGSRIYNHAW